MYSNSSVQRHHTAVIPAGSWTNLNKVRCTYTYRTLLSGTTFAYCPYRLWEK